MKSFITRTISAIFFAAIMLGGLLWSPLAFCGVFGFIIVVMMYEYLNITIGKKLCFGQWLSILSGLFLFVGVFSVRYFGLNPGILFALALPLSLIFISLLWQKGDYSSYPYLLSAIVYIALPFTLLDLLAFDYAGRFNGVIVLALFIILWASDVGAYLFGMTFGQKNGHKLFPSISPKKSWEGYIGSFFVSAVVGFYLAKFDLLPFKYVHAVVLAIVINVFATLGDLVESQLKRNFNVKDSGKIMPGHGGLLDRFDGALIAFPIAIAYIYIFGLI
jgi:phosphatidate cytidylyltransferase